MAPDPLIPGIGKGSARNQTMQVKMIIEQLVPGVQNRNKAYEPIYLSLDEMDSFRIIGKVVWRSRDVK